MLKNKNLIAGIVCAVFVFTLLFSVIFIAVEIHHDCTGENCPICMEIQACVQTLQTLGAALAPIILSITAIYSLVICAARSCHRSALHTLVSLKVKLTD